MNIPELKTVSDEIVEFRIIEIKFCKSQGSASILFSEAYDYITAHGYTPSYVLNPGICTWCRYNPLSKAARNLILDHILTKNLTVVGAKVGPCIALTYLRYCHNANFQKLNFS